MLKFTFFLFKSYLNNSSCVNGDIVFLQNCNVVRKEETSGSWDASDYPTCLSTYSPAVIWPRKVIMGPTEYHDIAAPNHHRTFPCRVSLLEPGIPDWVGVLET
jgi:hypothetical protein